MPSKYKLSPSAAPRFLVCTASLPHNLDFTESIHTLKGQLIHKVSQLRLEQIFNKANNNKKIERLMDPNIPYKSSNDPTLQVKWDSDCDKTADDYVSYVKTLYEQFKPKAIMFEYRIRMRFYGNKVNGVVDCVMILQNNDIIIVDLKTGRGKVDTDDNKQMLLYGYGIAQDIFQKTGELPNKIIISICQSLVRNTRAVEYTLTQVANWYASLSSVMNEINTDKLVYRPEPTACKYCQFREKCNVRIKEGVV